MMHGFAGMLRNLFGPKWKHSDADVRLKAVRKLRNQSILSGIAQNDRDGAVKQAAVERLTDQNSLARIAETAYRDTAAIALPKILDVALLGRIARCATNGDVRIAAAKQLQDESLLVAVAKGFPNADVRGRAVEAVTDGAALSDIALNDKDICVRSAAVERVKDPHVLATVAKLDENHIVAETAVRRLEDQQLLLDVAMNATDKNGCVKLAAVRKVGNPGLVAAVVADLVRDQYDVFVRIKALEMVKDQSLLADIAQHYNLDMKLVAVRRLTDQRLLASIAKNDVAEQVCYAALEIIKEQQLIEDIALAAASIYVRLSAAEKLGDPALLQKILAEMLCHSSPGVRLTAIRRVSDQALLAETARTDVDLSVRRWAAEKLEDKALAQELMGNIVALEKDVQRRRLALQEKEQLERIAETVAASTAGDQAKIDATLQTQCWAVTSIPEDGYGAPGWYTGLVLDHASRGILRVKAKAYEKPGWHWDRASKRWQYQGGEPEEFRRTDVHWDYEVYGGDGRLVAHRRRGASTFVGLLGNL